MRKVVSILIALLVTGALLAVASPAEAARKWPRGRITYVDQTKDSGAVKRAVRAWNRSGLKVRFVKVSSPRKAQLLIRNSRRVPGGCGTGLATLGYTPGRKAFVNILHGRDSDGQACAWPGQTLVVAHELGHVLGLGHTDKGCSLMNTSHTGGIAPTQCYDDDPQAEVGSWRCAIFTKSDLRRAKRIYGGTIKPLGPTWCDIAARPATGPLTVSADGMATVTRLPEPALPAWMPTWAEPGFELHVTPNTCSATPGDQTSMRTSLPWGADVAPGATATYYLGWMDPGTYCVSYWQRDRAVRYSSTPVTTMITTTGTLRAPGRSPVVPHVAPGIRAYAM
jgi:hypothetical protein